MLTQSKSTRSMKKVKVIVRVRPFLPSEVSIDRCVFINTPQNNIVELSRSDDFKTFTYSFDSCYNTDSVQETLYRQEISPHLPIVLKGFNTTVFCYGMTGAGKTHTMQGTEEDPGIIPRAVSDIFNLINCHPEKQYFRVQLSYFEIYNNKVFDLLKLSEKDLPIREDSNKNIFIPNLHQEPVSRLEDFTHCFKTACKNRKVGGTALNAQSSRSHAILRVTVELTQDTKKFVGKLHLIDLAGSEDNRQTNNSGMRMVESSSINSSLFVLGKVVEALNKGHQRIPYRDSKLTRLLQDSLGGNAQGIIIANIAPGKNHFFNTQQTLNFASKSRQVINTPVVHELVEEVKRKPYAVIGPSQTSNIKNQPRSSQQPLSASSVPKSTTHKPTTTSTTLKSKTQRPPQTAKLQRRQADELIDFQTERERNAENSLEIIMNKIAEIQNHVGLVPDKDGMKMEYVDGFKKIDQMSEEEKLKEARSCVLKAKQYKEIDPKRELHYYQKACELLPNAKKLKIKVKKLTQRLRLDDTSENDERQPDESSEEKPSRKVASKKDNNKKAKVNKHREEEEDEEEEEEEEEEQEQEEDKHESEEDSQNEDSPPRVTTKNTTNKIQVNEDDDDDNDDDNDNDNNDNEDKENMEDDQTEKKGDSETDEEGEGEKGGKGSLSYSYQSSSSSSHSPRSNKKTKQDASHDNRENYDDVLQISRLSTREEDHNNKAKQQSSADDSEDCSHPLPPPPAYPPLLPTTKENIKEIKVMKSKEMDNTQLLLYILNTFDKTSLKKHVNTVGEKRAEQIYNFRQQNGPFKSIYDLKQLEGNGKKWVDTLILKNQDISM